MPKSDAHIFTYDWQQVVKGNSADNGVFMLHRPKVGKRGSN